MIRQYRFFALGLAMCTWPLAVPAQQLAPAESGAPAVPKVSFERYSLPNGLKVILSPDRSAPVVALALTYNVGSWVEPVGKTGFAHLFEHMMFQGSTNVAKGEHNALIFENGGILNGTTSHDRTNYYMTLPANQLEMGLFLEADRMASLDVSQENLDNQRAVVQEERRRSYDNRPYGKLYEAILNEAYETFGYKHSTIGTMEDLNAATLEDVKTFFRTYYAPNNAVLTLAGDFDTNEAKDLIQKYFGSIPRGPAPALPELNEPKQTSERVTTLKDPLAPLPVWVAAYDIPHGLHADFPALDVLASVLSSGRSSRLYKALVEQKKVVTGVSANAQARRGPGIFTLEMEFAEGQEMPPALDALDEAIRRVQESGVTEEEIAKVRTMARRGHIESLRGVESLAISLGENEVMFGDANRVNSYFEQVYDVTPADVQRVARQYLLSSNRSVVIVEPASAR